MDASAMGGEAKALQHSLLDEALSETPVKIRSSHGYIGGLAL